METSERIQTSKDDSPPALPSLIKAITDHEVSGFDSVKKHGGLDKRLSSSTHQYPTSVFGIEEDNDRMDSVSISMPPSPDHMQKTKRVLFDNDDKILGQDDPYAYDMFKTSGGTTKHTKFYSQPLPKGSRLHEEIVKGNSAQLPRPTNHKLRDKRFDSFKTWSGGLERQLTNLRGRARDSEPDSQPHQHAEMGNVPVDRYFDALEGPELDVLRPSEQIILPEDKKWPFLLRFPISSFGICLGVSSQAIMWKTLASTESTKFLHISSHVNQIAWFISVALVVIVFIIYSLKLIFYFEAVRREYHHPIRVNFFFAPWIALLFLCLGVPPSVTETLHKSLWYILMSPFLILELKIYGQWMSGGQRRLSKVANPSNHLSIVGNFVGALLGANMGLKEGPIFFFAVGLAHYTVLFVTLYQRLPTNETLPRELHPVFFLFVAAPSVASMAWAKIVGHFDFGARITYFIAMFLYFSLAIRVNFFRGFTFSLAWWAYTFPMTGAAIASIRYSSVIDCTFTKTFAVVLCVVATLTVAALLVTTVIHAFVLRDLFPNDIAIAISDRRPKGSKSTRRWYHRRTGSSETSIQHYLKFSDAGDNQGGSVTSVNDPAAP